MEILFVGDLHGDFTPIARLAEVAPPEAMIIQVGDFGYWNYLKENWDDLKISRPVHFIDGNHEELPDLLKHKEITEVWPNLFYIPRGTILDFNGKKVGFCGGAGSIDRAFRTLMVDWFPDEAVTDEDLAKFHDKKVDLLVTHCPPVSMVKQNPEIFRPKDMLQFGVTEEWTDYSQIQIQKLWDKLGFPPLVCGHMHRAFWWKGATILDINQVYKIIL